MKNLLLILCLFSSVLLAEKTIDKKEAFFVNALELTEKLAEILETAKDGKNTQAAAVRIEQLIPKALEIKNKARESGMNNLSKEDRKRLTGKYQDRIAKASSKVMKLSMELRKFPEIMKAVIKIKKAMN